MNSSRTETKLKKGTFENFDFYFLLLTKIYKKNRSKSKKKDDVSKLSPTHSEVEEPITLKAIDGEDVQALAIKENDLKKVFI